MEDLGTPRSSIERPPAFRFPRRRHRRVPDRPRRGAFEPDALSRRRSRCCRRTAGARCRSSLVADQEFVALDDLATAFQLTVREESLGAVTVSYKGKTIVLTPDQALASVGGRLVSLPAPPSRNGRRWLVPVEFISRALSLIYDARLDLRKPSRLLVVGDLRVPRITVRYDPLGAAGRLTIDATPRATATVTQEAEHLTIKFDADALDAPNAPLPAPGSPGLILGVRTVDADDDRDRSRPALRRLPGDEPAGRHDDAAGDRSGHGADRRRAPHRHRRRRRRSRRRPTCRRRSDSRCRRSARSRSIRATAATTRA